MKKKILVVEDNKSLRELLKEYLELNGYEVMVARDGQEGMMLLKKSFDDFDLIITDFRMPKMNGIEVIRFIKQRDPTIKTILVTGEDMRLVAPVAEAAGADKVMAKPVDFSYLQKTVKELLEK